MRFVVGFVGKYLKYQLQVDLLQIVVLNIRSLSPRPTFQKYSKIHSSLERAEASGRPVAAGDGKLADRPICAITSGQCLPRRSP
jgi:hypothetical protein